MSLPIEKADCNTIIEHELRISFTVDEAQKIAADILKNDPLCSVQIEDQLELPASSVLMLEEPKN